MKQKSQTEFAAFLNNQSYINYLDRLKMLATSLFKWNGLDDVAGFGASRFLELILFENGRACFVKDVDLGFLCLGANPCGKLNVYRLPTKINAFSTGYNKTFDIDDVVYIMNNELEIPTFRFLQPYAYRLYNVERTIDVNVDAQKTPVLIEGKKDKMLTLNNLYTQYSGNIPFIFGDKDFDLSKSLNVLKTDAPYIVDKLDIHKHELWNDCLTVLGINNANTDKKERLITDEVESNDQLIEFNLNCWFEKRKEAAELINEKFDLNIEVLLNEKAEEKLNQTIEDGDENGEIYNYD